MYILPRLFTNRPISPMNRLLIAFFFLSISLNSFAQIGLNAGFATAHTPEWKEFVNSINGTSDVDVLDNGFHVGVDYWFKVLKDYRIEAMPELSYTTMQNRGDNAEYKFKADKLSLHFNTNIYLFNMESDCNCPTFSKDGPSLQKGFFIRIGPGVSYINHSIGTFTGNEEIAANNEVVFDLRLGVGIDFGLSDFLTITPIIQADRVFKSNWERLHTISAAQIEVENDNISVFDKLFFGIRVGLRFDELNKYGYR